MGIADSYIEAADKVVALRPASSTVYKDYHELLKDKAVEAVVVATPTFMKKEVVGAPLEAGKHVFCEKPMALTLPEADEFIAMTERSGTKFQVGYQRRFDPRT